LKLEVKIENDTLDDCKKIILDEVYTGYIRTIQDDGECVPCVLCQPS
jgi:hypothetical protein